MISNVADTKMGARPTQFERAKERPIVASGQLTAVRHVCTHERAVQAIVERLRIERRTCITTFCLPVNTVFYALNPTWPEMYQEGHGTKN